MYLQITASGADLLIFYFLKKLNFSKYKTTNRIFLKFQKLIVSA